MLTKARVKKHLPWSILLSNHINSTSTVKTSFIRQQWFIQTRTVLHNQLALKATKDFIGRKLCVDRVIWRVNSPRSERWYIFTRKISANQSVGEFVGSNFSSIKALWLVENFVYKFSTTQSALIGEEFVHKFFTNQSVGNLLPFGTISAMLSVNCVHGNNEAWFIEPSFLCIPV